MSANSCRSISIDFASILVESKLRNDSRFKADVESFFRLNSPSFNGFSQQFNPNSGIGASLDLVTKFKHFVELLESNIARILLELDISNEAFEASLELLVARKDDSAVVLRDFLFGLTSFLPFCQVMESKCEELYGRDPSTTGGRALISGRVSTDTFLSISATQLVQPNNNYTAHVRVLWDIENITVPKGFGGIECIDRLTSYLAKKNLHGPGIDFRISAFFNPDTSSLSKRCIHELDKAGVEMVWVSTKREDADRKIVLRLNQDVTVLPNTTTFFVIISSDQDFCQNMKVLRNSGFRVFVVHNVPRALPNTKQWIQALAMSADECMEWRTIIGALDVDDTDASGTRDDLTRGIRDIREKDRRSDVDRDRDKYKDKSKEKAKELVGEMSLEIGWLPCVCIRWKGAFGFLTAKKKDIINSYIKKFGLIGSVSRKLEISMGADDNKSDENELRQTLETLFHEDLNDVGLLRDKNKESISYAKTVARSQPLSLGDTADNELLHSDTAISTSFRKDVDGEYIRIFCHHTAIGSEGGALRRDDEIVGLVAYSAKGFRVISVMSTESFEKNAKSK